MLFRLTCGGPRRLPLRVVAVYVELTPFVNARKLVVVFTHGAVRAEQLVVNSVVEETWAGGPGKALG